MGVLISIIIEATKKKKNGVNKEVSICEEASGSCLLFCFVFVFVYQLDGHFY